MKKIYNGSWESTLLFKARTDSLEVNEKRNKWGGDKDSCEKCEIRKERNTETLDHVLIECPEYKSERLNFETEVKRTIGDREWETIKQGEDKRNKRNTRIRRLWAKNDRYNKEIPSHDLEKEEIEQEGTGK